VSAANLRFAAFVATGGAGGLGARGFDGVVVDDRRMDGSTTIGTESVSPSSLDAARVALAVSLAVSMSAAAGVAPTPAAGCGVGVFSFLPSTQPVTYMSSGACATRLSALQRRWRV
jgi:hypothetical protein